MSKLLVRVWDVVKRHWSTFLSVVAALAALWGAFEAQRSVTLTATMMKIENAQVVTLNCEMKDVKAYNDDYEVPKVFLDPKPRGIIQQYTIATFPEGSEQHALDCFLMNNGNRVLTDIRSKSKVHFVHEELQVNPDQIGDVEFEVGTLGVNEKYRVQFVNLSNMYATWKVPDTITVKVSSDQRFSIDIPLMFFRHLVHIPMSFAEHEVVFEPVERIHKSGKVRR